VTLDNVATLRRYHELLNETGEAPLELVDPEVEIHMFRGSPIAGPYLGRERDEAVAAAGIAA
jgi:hypothetical protein